MKKIIAALLCLMLAFTLVPAEPAQAAYGTATVRGGWLVLRAAPSFDAEIIASYYTGTVVTVIGISGSWYQVTTPDNNIGYMYSAYLTTGGSATPVTPVTPVTPTTSTTAYVYASNGGNVRLRTGPGQSYNVIGSYRVGTQVTILNPGTYWHYITVGSQSGYMMAKYLVSYNPGGGSVTPITPVTPTTGTTAYVYASNGLPVRLRSGPGQKYSVITAYNVGTQVTVLQYGATWSYIRVGTTLGYMMSRYLTNSSAYIDTTVRSVSLNTLTPGIGTVLTATVSPTSASVSYQWMNDYGAILGTSSNYVVQASDYGRRIRVQVYGTGASSGSAISSFTNAVGSYVPVVPTTPPVVPTVPPVTPTAPPVTPTVPLTGLNLTSSSVVAGTVVGAAVTPIGATASFTWYRDGSPVGTSEVYLTSTADVGHSLMVVAVGTGSYSGSVSKTVVVTVASSYSGGMFYAATPATDSSAVYSTDVATGDIGGGTNYWASGY